MNIQYSSYMQQGSFKILRFRLYPGILYLGFLLYVLGACNKTAYNPQSFPVHAVPQADTLHNLRHMIDSLPSSDLFLLALKRTGYDSLLSQTSAFYTLMVPTDSLLIAAGYTKDVITYLDPSLLLTGIIVPQVWNGQIADSTLDEADGYVTATSITDPSVKDPTIGPNRYPVAKQGGPTGGLWISGVRVSNERSGVRASNGYVHVVNAFYTAPVLNAWNVLLSRPEFSYFVAACQIDDSVVQAVGAYYQGTYGIPGDMGIFQGQNGNAVNFTYFVPTNQAFINAGFNTIQDIRDYAVNNTIADPNGILLSPLDSIIYGHWMPNSNLYYFDLLKNPNLNQREAADLRLSMETELYNVAVIANTDPNGYGLPSYGLGYPYKGVLHFQVSDTTVSITCNSATNPPAAKVVEHDIMCTNGVILHGVDHLFWPY